MKDFAATDDAAVHLIDAISTENRHVRPERCVKLQLHRVNQCLLRHHEFLDDEIVVSLPIDSKEAIELLVTSVQIVNVRRRFEIGTFDIADLCWLLFEGVWQQFLNRCLASTAGAVQQ